MLPVLTSCSAPNSAPPPVDKVKITAVIRGIVAENQATYNAGDAAANVANDAPDIVLMSHGQPNMVGPAADLAATKQLFAAGPTSYSLSNDLVDIADSGEMAVYRGTYVFNYTDPGTKKPMTEYGNEVVGFRKDPAGAWKIAWAVVTDTPPPGPPPTSHSRSGRSRTPTAS